MKKWEYCYALVDPTTDPVGEPNKLGEEGWEICAYEPENDTHHGVFYMKREVVSGPRRRAGEIMSETLARRFDEWAKAAQGPHYATTLSRTQLQETERAFMSGFAACFFATKLEITELSDDNAEKALMQIEQELRDYFAAFKSMPRNTETN